MFADRFPLFARSLSDSRRGIVGWTIAVAATSLMYLASYQTVASAKTSGINNLPESVRVAFDLQDVTSGAGYVQSTVLGMLALVLITVAAVAVGSKAIAGDEETGSLELTLAHGVTRQQVLRQRAAALVVQVGWLAAVVALAILVVTVPVHLGIDAGQAFAGALALGALALVNGAAALAAGAFTGRRVVALVAGVAVAVLGYLANTIGAVVDGVRWLQTVSPVHWAFAERPLTNGVDRGGIGLLLLVAGLLVAVGAWQLNRRDIGV
ncbi:MAG TPA: ABC transporter permease subunit [Kineosporiaceae bacterium]|nr:ABC transporter permease subunit [Kineosporiaceae bacterium]